jgi:hypothetical protein
MRGSSPRPGRRSWWQQPTSACHGGDYPSDAASVPIRRAPIPSARLQCQPQGLLRSDHPVLGSRRPEWAPAGCGSCTRSVTPPGSTLPGPGASTATVLACSGQTWPPSLARVSARPWPSGRRDAAPLPAGADHGWLGRTGTALSRPSSELRAGSCCPDRRWRARARGRHCATGRMQRPLCRRRLQPCVGFRATSSTACAWSSRRCRSGGSNPASWSQPR